MTNKEMVPLKKVCRLANVESRVARRLLRSSPHKRTGGRWEWTEKQSKVIVRFLRQELHGERC